MRCLPAETFITRFNFVTYSGDYSRDQPLPIAGLTVLGVNADSTAAGLTLLWRPPVEIGEDWSYAMSATIPYVWMDVHGRRRCRQAGTKSVSDSEDGLGDIVLMPLMLNYKACDDLNFNFRVGGYAPTGDYEVGRLANTGKNFWTIEPTLARDVFRQEERHRGVVVRRRGLQLENEDTDYKTGTQFHIDGTLAQHFPLAGGFAGVGVNGYWYEQVTGDSGDGREVRRFQGPHRGPRPGRLLRDEDRRQGPDRRAEMAARDRNHGTASRATTSGSRCSVKF